MAPVVKKGSHFLVAILICLAANGSAVGAARKLVAFQPGAAAARGFNLKQMAMARLQQQQGEEEEEALGGLMDCWNALSEIKACSNEILIFFINGTSDIGPACCQAIGIITHHCWPAMLSALGFTPEEANVLRGYCDASTAGPAPSPSDLPPPPPPPSPLAPTVVVVV
ncbi:egg cell-secreted protein 1.5-like [Diospyros lotus]|uniref:egg cell-secreted protein 1.5-like n=1 Tax=Diospyros lotus TaxID=55363 RepID=UPI00224E94BA|nr:egg cell-secreted protein 1.5-like [Diospyros lotus]